jgi:uroporphyrinogen-III decarboxylase
MTRKEAFLTALRLETPDVVPVAPLIHHRYANEVLGRTDWRAVYEVHQMLGTTHHRGPIGVGYATEGESPWTDEVTVLEEDGSYRVTETITTGPGCNWRAVDVKGMIPHDPICGKRTEYPIKTPDDWRTFIAMREDWLSRATKPWFATAQEAHELMGEDGIASVGIGGVYGAIGNYRGMEQLLYDLYDIPELIHEVIEVQLQVVERNVESFLASPNEVGWLDICWATGSNMSPAMFEEFTLPEMQLVCDMVRAVPGKFVGLYTLGRIRELMPAMMKAAPHFIETFEPNEGDISLAEAKREYGRDTCIMGNFDCLVLAMGTVEDARREAQRCLDEAMEGGGYVMVTADEVPADTKWDNLVAWAETVAEHGRY